jgi:hypothetical protein
MIERNQIQFGLIFYGILVLLLCGLQTSLLSQVLGSDGAPYLFLVVTTYLALHRNIWEAIGSVYLISFLASNFTDSPWGFLVIGQLGVILAVQFLRNRIFWPGHFYFVLTFLLAIATFQVIVALTSTVFDENPTPGPFWASWFFQTLWAPVVSIPSLHIMQFMDHILKKQSVVAEIERQ